MMRKKDEAPAEVTKDPADLTGEDAIRLVGESTEPDEETEPADDAEPESEDEFEEEPEGDKPEEESKEEDDEELSEDWRLDEEETETDRFALDESVLDGIPEDARKRIKKRWDEQTRGVRKREAQLEGQAERLKVLDSYATAFSDKRTVGNALNYLTNQLAEQHGMTARELRGEEPTSEPPESLDTVEGILKAAEERALARLKSEMGPQLEAIDKENKARAERESLDAYVAKAFPIVKKAVSKLDGITPTKAEFIEAITNIPSLKNQPIKAYRKWFGDRIADHKTKSVSAKPKAPDLGTSASRQSPVKKDWADLTAADVFASLRK